jgi:hypothetical protein
MKISNKKATEIHELIKEGEYKLACDKFEKLFWSAIGDPSGAM